MDNQIKPTRVSPLESLMGNARDTFLVGMTQQIDQHEKKKKDDGKKLVLKFRKPIETLGLGFKEISTFDTENSKEFGWVELISLGLLSDPFLSFLVVSRLLMKKVNVLCFSSVSSISCKRELSHSCWHEHVLTHLRDF